MPAARTLSRGWLSQWVVGQRLSLAVLLHFQSAVRVMASAQPSRGPSLHLVSCVLSAILYNAGLHATFSPPLSSNCPKVALATHAINAAVRRALQLLFFSVRALHNTPKLAEGPCLLLSGLSVSISANGLRALPLLQLAATTLLLQPAPADRALFLRLYQAFACDARIASQPQIHAWMARFHVPEFVRVPVF
jgi:hypothetical protein